MDEICEKCERKKRAISLGRGCCCYRPDHEGKCGFFEGAENQSPPAAGSASRFERRKCDGCGKMFDYEIHANRPPDRPPICCTILCHEKTLAKRGSHRVA